MATASDHDPRLPSLPTGCPTSISAPGSGGPTPLLNVIQGAGNPDLGVIPGQPLVVPHTHAMYLDEFVAGVEYELLEDLRVGVSYQNRQLGRVIEDMSPDGGNTYVLGNPGDIDPAAFDELRAQINTMPEGSQTRTYLENRLRAFEALNKFDKPTRNYNAFQVTVAKRFSRSFMVQGSYTYSVLRGNYPGLFSPDTGQLDPNITSQYDLVELLANREGALPFDRPHSVKLDGYYAFNLESAGQVTTGVRFRAQSGTPVQTLGEHSSYGPNESYILPRGTDGRTVFEVNADLHLAYARKIGSTQLELSFELFNLFNNQEEAAVDQTYTHDIVNPIVGGTTADLPYLKQGFGGTSPGTIASKNPNYRNTTARFAPLAGRFGATLSF